MAALKSEKLSTLPLLPEAPPLVEEPSGTVRIGTSRITLDVLIEAYQGGLSPLELIEQFDAISEAEIFGTLAYYHRHKEEVTAYLKRRQAEAETLRQTIEARQKPLPSRDELQNRIPGRKGS